MSEKLTIDRKNSLICRQIEIDLRNWIGEEILNSKKFQDCVDESTYKKCLDYCIKRKKRLNERVIGEQIGDKELLEYIDFSTAIQILNNNKIILQESSREVFENIKNELVNLKDIRNDAQHGRILLDKEYEKVENFCDRINEYSSIFVGTSNEWHNLENGVSSDVEDFEDIIDEREHIHNLPRPEYSDTGFIERKELNNQLKNKIKNNNVISFIGDAGSGKTAFALKKCYDYLSNKDDNDFETFIYHSFKTEKFSRGEIIDLQNDINTTDKFFEMYKLKNLSDDPIKNLIKHLENNKVLLFLDNLENVLDNNIINFLELFSEAEHNSKIFLTSRIPVGHGEIPIKVGSFTDKEAINYFQRLCRYNQLSRIQKELTEKDILDLVKKRVNNPLYIKLAIEAVADGKSIEDSFKPEKDLLNFSYKNLFESLDNNSIKVLENLYLLNKELNLSTICDLIKNISPDEIQKSLRKLIQKSFIIFSLKQSQTEYYYIRKEVLNYLQKNEIFNDVKKKDAIYNEYKKLITPDSTIKININDIKNIPPEWEHFLCRKKSDISAISRLKKISRIMGFKHIGSEGKFRDFTQREEEDVKSIFDDLKLTHGDYSEVYRIEGVYHTLKLNTAEAIKSFQLAIQLQKNYQNTYYFFSDALLTLQEFDLLLTHARETVKLFPEFLDAARWLLMAKVFNNQYDEESEKMYATVDSMLYQKLKYPMKYKRKLGMMLVRYHLDKAEYFVVKQNYHDALKSLQDGYDKYFDLENHNLVDIFTLNKLGKSLHTINSVRNNFRGEKEEGECKLLTSAFHNAKEKVQLRSEYNLKTVRVGDTIVGTLKRDDLKKGFLVDLNGKIILKGRKRDDSFFIPNQIVPKNLRPGDRIKFKLDRFLNKNNNFMYTAKEIEKI